MLVFKKKKKKKKKHEIIENISSNQISKIKQIPRNHKSFQNGHNNLSKSKKLTEKKKSPKKTRQLRPIWTEGGSGKTNGVNQFLSWEGLIITTRMFRFFVFSVVKIFYSQDLRTFKAQRLYIFLLLLYHCWAKWVLMQ